MYWLPVVSSLSLLWPAQRLHSPHGGQRHQPPPEGVQEAPGARRVVLQSCPIITSILAKFLKMPDVEDFSLNSVKIDVKIGERQLSFSAKQTSEAKVSTATPTSSISSPSSLYAWLRVQMRIDRQIDRQIDKQIDRQIDR